MLYQLEKKKRKTGGKYLGRQQISNEFLKDQY